MSKSSAPFISPDITAKGVLELQTKFPKVRDYDEFWDGIRRSIDEQGVDARILEYGTARHGDIEYTLRALEMGEEGNPVRIIQGGTHGYEESAPEAIAKGLREGRLQQYTERNRLILPIIAVPVAYEHDLRFIVGKDYKGRPTITDTNRDFPIDPSQAETEEGKYLAEFLMRQGQVYAYFDGHETPQADIDVWRPFAEKYKGRVLTEEDLTIPQGAFVIVQKRDDPLENKAQLAFGHAVMKGLAEHSPVAPEPELLGKHSDQGVTQGGPLAGTTRTFMTAFDAEHVVVTELNPDMEGMSPAKARDSQLAGIEAALSFEG